MLDDDELFVAFLMRGGSRSYVGLDEVVSVLEDDGLYIERAGIPTGPREPAEPSTATVETFGDRMALVHDGFAVLGPATVIPRKLLIDREAEYIDSVSGILDIRAELARAGYEPVQRFRE